MLSLLFLVIVPTQPAGGGENAASLLLAQAKLQTQATQYDTALATLQKILDTAPDDLVSTAVAGHRINARRAVNDYLLTWPEEGLKLYRTRYDGLAKKRLDAAIKETENRGLESLVETFPVATSTEIALLELARRSFQKGDFSSAVSWWKLLDRFPNATTPKALTKARIILGLHFAGDTETAVKELAELEKAYPDTKGNLFDKSGAYSQILKEWLEKPVAQISTSLDSWPTLGGDATRNGMASRLPVFFPEKPFYSAPLPTAFWARLSSPPPNPDHPKGLAIHPILVGDSAYFTDGASVWSYDVAASKVNLLGTFGKASGISTPNRGETMLSMSHANGLLFFRSGAREWKANEKPESELVCITTTGKKCWGVSPPKIADTLTVWEGAPTVIGKRWYASYLKVQGADVRCGVVCYGGFSDTQPGELLWNTELGKAEANVTQATTRGHVLSVAEGRVFLSTHAGQILALNSETGKHIWDYQYASNEKRQGRYRDLLPCVVHGGVLFAAPFDTDILFAFESATGRPLWSRSGIEVIHLFGVSQRKLIATVGGNVKGIRGIDIATGSDSGSRGWTQHDDSGESTFGRGFVTEDAIAWPTANGLQLLNPEDGRPLRSPIANIKGNLVYSNGILVSLTTMEIRSYLSEKRRSQILLPSGELPKDTRLKIAVDELRFAEVEGLSEGVSPDLIYQVANTLDGFQQPTIRVPMSKVKETGNTKADPLPSLPEMRDDLTRIKLKSLEMRVTPVCGSSSVYLINDQAMIGETRLPIKHRVQEAFTFKEAVILVGENGLSKIEIATSKILWEFLAPFNTNQRFHLLDATDIPERFQNFQVVGGVIIFRVGEQVWHGLDSQTGKTRWVQFAQSERQLVGASGPKFSPLVGVSEKTILLQNTLGEVRSVDVASGVAKWIYGGPSQLWSVAPVFLKDRWLISDSPDGLVVLTQAEGKLVGEWSANDSEDAVGTLPRCLLSQSGVVVAIERNYGTEVHLLNEKTWKPLWKKSLLLSQIEPSQILAITKRHLLIQHSNEIASYKLDTGEADWKRKLPAGSGWSLLASSESGYLFRSKIAIPEIARSHGGDLISIVFALYHGYEQAEFPLVKLDAQTGQLRQTFRIACSGPKVSITPHPNGWDIVTSVGNWRIENSDPK